MVLPRNGVTRTSLILFGAIASLILLSYITSPQDMTNRTTQHGYCTPDAGVGATRAEVRSLVSGLRVMNYFPARNAGTSMWSHWDPATIDTDFGRIAGLHANTVRLFIFPAFGYPQPSSTMINRLADLIALAHKHGLRVQLTLFGYWSNYGDIRGSEQWAQAVLAPYRNDPRVAFIEVQNELDSAQPGAYEWARTMTSCVRAIAGHIPITLSISGAAGISGFRQLVAAHVPIDFYDLHYYGPAALAYRTFQQALSAAGHVPLFIGETGYSTQPTTRPVQSPDTPRWREAYQDQYYRTVEYAARALGLPPAAPWILNDFTQAALPPSSATSDPAEYGFGLFRTDGTAKPAAASIRAAFSGAPVDTSFNNGFETGDGSNPSMPTNWLVWQPSFAAFARDTSVAHTGTASARISHSLPDTFGYPAFYLSPILYTEPGRTYRASVWAKGEDATGTTHLSLSWFDANGTYFSTNSSTDLPLGTTGWTRLQVMARAPANAASVQIDLVSADNRGSAWFDDVSMDRVQQP